ncbi:MAG: TIR domain-containing protein, partial [Ruminococcus sp.]|nr:TIR domain-containing protein [Ruminococcus sp.]
MAQLWYKTRGESSPDRKQKVYFSAHPKDYRLLDGIAAEILEHQNCAVWYDKEPEAEFDEKEFASRLEEMQLFVMPVTTRLLTKPNRALEFEFALAQRRHIPVLPLMQEDGLEELFNEKCGDLQFLYKYSRDTTGISYEEKLKKYLEAVLVGEEDAKRIREAFAAYIFLSYRKKDREHAQKLMRLIHKVDFCRDVAIWYDEFLTPGENFTNLIKESLDKSDLFVLAVTPNLLEKDNYVMNVEYPMAVEQNKPVLPAEIVSTGKNELCAKYNHIPDCVDAEDAEALKNSLSEHFSAEQKNTPEQLYLMGLAYLNGVDVERDEEKAISLITAAAEQEHVEALEKIVQLYREGFGVKRNYELAIEWQRKLVDAREKLYRETESEDDAYMFFSVLWNLGDYIYELKKIKEAREVYMRMLDVSLEFTDKFSGFWAQRDLSVSYNKLGNISTSTGDLNGAKEYYQKSHDIRIAIAQETDTIQSRRDLSISYNKLGDICTSTGDLNGAKEYYQKSHDIRL